MVELPQGLGRKIGRRFVVGTSRIAGAFRAAEFYTISIPVFARNTYPDILKDKSGYKGKGKRKKKEGINGPVRRVPFASLSVVEEMPGVERIVGNIMPGFPSRLSSHKTNMLTCHLTMLLMSYFERPNASFLRSLAAAATWVH